MVGIDNSVKVAKLISDLNNKINALNDENFTLAQRLKDSMDRESALIKKLNNATDLNKKLNEDILQLDKKNGVLEEVNKANDNDLYYARYECDKNMKLADNYAAEAYEWQKKYYREKEKHEKATKKVSEFKRKANFYKSKYKTNEWVKVILSAPKHKPYKHAKQQSGFDYRTNKVKFDETKEEILDLCDDIDSKINAWWKGRIYDPDFENAIDDDLSKIIKIVLSDNYNPSHDSNIIGICLKVKDKIRNWACYYDEDLVRDIQEAVSKIRQTAKEAE